MGLATRIGSGIDKAAKAGGRATKTQASHHPTIATGVGAFAGGYAYHSYRHSRPEFYDATPNKGRAQDKHPGGSY